MDDAPTTRLARASAVLVRCGGVALFGVAGWLAWVLLVVRPFGIRFERGWWTVILAGCVVYGALSLGLAGRPQASALRWAQVPLALLSLGIAVTCAGIFAHQDFGSGDPDGFYLPLTALFAFQPLAVAVFLVATRRRGAVPSATARA